jgi:NDP-sugar pyrophosphorylase family protein
MQMVIICGGLATRLGALAKNIPKSMMEIEDKPFLWYQIENLKKQNIKDIVLCVGHLSEQIEKYFGDGKSFGVNISYSYDKEKPLGPIGAVKNAESMLDNEFFIIYGDSYLSVDFQDVIEYFKKYDYPALMVVYKNNDKFDKSNLIIKDNLVVGYGEKDKSKEMIYIDYGTSLLTKKSLEIVPKNEFFSTGQFFSKLIENKNLLSYEVNKRFYHIGDPDSLEEIRLFIKNR